MFYSHEILSDRKHGVATIWLVATLGSKSSLKKITRKAIMEVNVPNACGTITDPTAPMALRLQGNLLFGVSRVFSQQCAYVLTDMQSLRDKMRGIQMLLKELETDPGVSNVRPEQLNLQADPGFNVDLDIGFDLSAFDVSFSSSEPSSLMSPRTFASSQTSFMEDEQMMDIGLPLDVLSSQGAGDAADFDFAGLKHGTPEECGQSRVASERAREDEFAVALEPLFHMSEDGELVFPDQADDLGFGQLELSQGLVQDGQDDFQLEVGEDENQGHIPDPRFDSDGPQEFFDAEEFPRDTQDPEQQTAGGPSSPAEQQLHESVEHDEQEDSEHEQEETETVAGAAPQRTARARALPLDEATELQNRTLSDWNVRYIEYMEAAHLENAGKISATQAKRNAAFWVLDQGIGGVDVDFHGEDDHPLAVFSGQALLDALVETHGDTGSRKRTRSATGEEADDTSRRVRSRSQEEVVTGATDQVMADDDQGITLGEDEFEPQMGREQQAPISDQPDIMPWNLYASSRQGSTRPGSARPPMSAAAVSSSAGGRAGFDIAPSSLGSKRISRLISESPLEQRRRLLRHSSILSGSRKGQDEGEVGSTGDDFILGDDVSATELDRQLAANLGIDDGAAFELYGPAAAVSTQQAANPEWLAATLEEEAFNFLSFLRTTIEGKQADLAGTQDEEDEGDTAAVTVTFEELLPSEQNSNVVAAQGLLHVLSLATKGLVEVNQEEDFGDINLGIAGGMGGGGEEAAGVVEVEG